MLRQLYINESPYCLVIELAREDQIIQNLRIVPEMNHGINFETVRKRPKGLNDSFLHISKF